MSPDRARCTRNRRMSPCRRPHRTNCCASAVPITLATVPSKPDAEQVRTETMPAPRLLAVSDLHVRYPENRAIVEALRPTSDGDWLIVAGDVAERVDDVVRTLALLRERFASVVWVPGNHELWTRPKEGVLLRGEERYRHLVQACRDHGVLTPEDPYPVWDGDGGPAVVAPLFVLYDYSFLPDGAATAAEGLEVAYNAG